MKDKSDKSLVAALEALKKSNRTASLDPLKDVNFKKSEAAEEPIKRKSSQSADISRGHVFPGATKVLGVVDVFWNQWARPVARFLNPITRHVWAFYTWTYRKFAHVKDEDDSARVFSRNRAAIVTVVLGLITIAMPFLVVRNIIPSVSRAVYDAGMLTTMQEDQLFLGRAELVDLDRGVYQVMGCRDIAGCDGGENTIYYRLRDNVLLNIKYWTTRFEPYDPAEIAGAMVSELNDCKITYYGRRSKVFGWYPYIVRASCVPV